MRRLVCCALVLFGTLTRSAYAEPVTLVFTGQVTDVPAALASGFSLGDLAQWQVTYDTVQTPLMQFGGSAIYGQSAFSEMNGSIGSKTIGLDPAPLAPQQWISRIDRDPGSLDRLDYAVNYYSTPTYFMSGTTLGAFRPWEFFWGFNLADGVLPGLSIPGHAFAFESGTFQMYYRDPATDRNEVVRGQIGSVYSVPEPSTLALIATGALVLFARSRFGRRVS